MHRAFGGVTQGIGHAQDTGDRFGRVDGDGMLAGHRRAKGQQDRGAARELRGKDHRLPPLNLGVVRGQAVRHGFRMDLDFHGFPHIRRRGGLADHQIGPRVLGGIVESGGGYPAAVAGTHVPAHGIRRRAGDLGVQLKLAVGRQLHPPGGDLQLDHGIGRVDGWFRIGIPTPAAHAEHQGQGQQGHRQGQPVRAGVGHRRVGAGRQIQGKGI